MYLKPRRWRNRIQFKKFERVKMFKVEYKLQVVLKTGGSIGQTADFNRQADKVGYFLLADFTRLTPR